MDFDLTSEQQEIRKLAKDFADREIAPGARERDRSEIFPKDVLAKMAPLGLLGGPVPVVEPPHTATGMLATLSGCVAVLCQPYTSVTGPQCRFAPS